MKRVLILIAIVIMSSPAWGLDIDQDSNDAVDLVYGGTNATTASGARTNLGLVIGTDVAAQGHTHSGVYEPVDATILKTADIGVSVAAHAAAASQAEMEEGTEAALRAMSPLRVAQAIAAQAQTGSGYLKDDGTVPLIQDWNAEKAITAESFTTPKTSGVAGDMGLYEANSTDVDTAGFRGPASMTGNTSYRIELPAAKPGSAMTLSISGTSSTGSGTPANPYVNAATFVPANKIVTKTTATTYTIGTTDPNEAYGGVIYVTGACTVTAPAIAAGMSFTVITVGAYAVSLDVNASDKMILDGVTLDDGDKATNTSTSGDMIVCTYYSADGWYCASGSNDGDLWTDGGA